jgi:cellulose synthase/poly-beta-1,6-N-acetylglucosamine synthase-like glycosyltransferase
MRGLCDAIRKLTYPADRVRVVLIDDNSSDGTDHIIQELCSAEGSRWTPVALRGRQRGKAQALRDGLRDQPVGEDDLIFVVDADHRLEPHSVERLADWFADPSIGAVSVQHPVKEADANIVSAYCSLEAAVNEEVTSRGQDALGLSVRLAGCWACRGLVFHTCYPSGWLLNDDTVFTANIAASGRRIRYASDVRSFQEVPGSLKGYVSQHMRWASGYVAAAPQSYGQAHSAKSTLQKLDFWMTHAGYFERPVLIVLLAACIASLVLPDAQWVFPASAGIFAGYALIVVVQIVAALALTRASLRQWWLSLISLSMVPVDAIISAIGIWRGLMGRGVEWNTSHRA